jgi:hypothetical protein
MGFLFLFLALTAIFFINLKAPLDPDLGWHLADGRYFLEHRTIPRLDMLSHSMSDYPWIAHEWLTDIIFFWIYNNFGFWPLVIIFSLISSAAFLLAASAIFAKIEYRIIAALIGALASVPIIGVRPQVITLFGLGLIIFLLFNWRRTINYKMIFWLPLIFLFWANLHGGFVIGLAVLFLFLFLEIMKFLYQKIPLWKPFLIFSSRLSNKIWLGRFVKYLFNISWLRKEVLSKQLLKKLSLIFLISLLATLVNPYGIGIYREIYNTFSQTQAGAYVKEHIGEWQKITSANTMSHFFIIYVIFLGFLVLLNIKRLDSTLVVFALFFLYPAFSSWRNMPVYIVITLPLWVSSMQNLVGQTLSSMVRSKLVIFLLLLATGFIVWQRGNETFLLVNSPEKAAKAGNYPYGAVQYIKQHLDQFSGNMFNEYNWGGYLTWQLPEEKVFIDGRMAIWQLPGRNPFEDHDNFLSGKMNYSQFIKKYDIDWALIFPQRVVSYILVDDGWQILYQDEISIILKKP